VSDIARYQSQVSPELPKGVSPFTLIGGFHPPDTQVVEAAGRGLDELGSRIADLAIRISASDQNAEVARGRADYFSRMTDWTRNVDKSDLDPKEYRTEFDRESNAVAGEISKGFRYADSHDQFSIWRTEQDVPLLGETLQKQLTVMNDRFGASLQRDFELVGVKPSYLPTALTNVTNAENSGAIKHAAAETIRQNLFKRSEGAQALQEGEKIGSAAMSERLQNMSLYTHLDEEDRKKIVSDLVFGENVRAQALVEEDKNLETHYADVLLKARTPKDIYAALEELKGKQFHNGDTTYQWQQRFRAELPKPGDEDWTNDPPDPVVYDQWATYKTAVRFSRRLPNDPAYGPAAGQVPSSADARVWSSDRKMQLGSTYRSEREAIDDLENDRYRDADQKLDDLFKSNEFKKRYGNDPVKTYQAQGDITDRIHDYIDKHNPGDKELFAKMYAFTLPQTKPITEDVPTTAQGAELGLRLWNDLYPDRSWKDSSQLQNEIEKLALSQRKKLGGYLGKELNRLPGLSSPPTAPGQEGFLMGSNGIAAFYVKDGKGQTQTYAYMPEGFDSSKPVGQRYSGNLKLRQYVGGKWVDLPAPEVTPSPEGFIPAKTIAGYDRNAIVNKINALKTQRGKTQQFIATQDRIISDPHPGEDPTQAFGDREAKQRELQKIDNNIANLENALRARGAQ